MKSAIAIAQQTTVDPSRTERAFGEDIPWTTRTGALSLAYAKLSRCIGVSQALSTCSQSETWLVNLKQALVEIPDVIAYLARFGALHRVYAVGSEEVTDEHNVELNSSALRSRDFRALSLLDRLVAVGYDEPAAAIAAVYHRLSRAVVIAEQERGGVVTLDFAALDIVDCIMRLDLAYAKISDAIDLNSNGEATP